MDAPDASRDNARLHVSTLLIAAPRALNNALDQLGFPENDDRVIEHEGKLAFIVCSHDADCDDLFALITELSARGESWELQFRIDTGENRAIFQRLSRHDRVEAVDSALPPEDDPETREMPSHDLDLETGRALGIAHEQVGQPQRPGIGSAASCHPVPLRARPAEVLHGREPPGLDHVNPAHGKRAVPNSSGTMG